MKLSHPGFAGFIVIIAISFVNAFADTSPSERPNVLFIAIDDFKPLLGCYGTSWIKSPSIDQLAAQGVRFESAYCQVALCAPTRFSLLTGLRPDSSGVYFNPPKAHDVLRSRLPDVVTLPQHFKNNGYIVCGMGKVYDGRTVDAGDDVASWSVPYVRRFEVAPGDMWVQGYQDPETKKYLTHAKKLSPNKPVWGPPVENCDVPDNAYYDGAMALTAAAKIREFSAANKPFFLAVGFHKPHLPFIAPKKYWDLYDRSALPLAPNQLLPAGTVHDLGFYGNSGELRPYKGVPKTGPIPESMQRELIHGYAACASYIDAQVGLIMQALKESGVADNTIICLWGDHGWHLGEHGHWGKLTDYEDAACAPLILSVPGIKGGLAITSLTEFLDIYPTLCDLTGLPQPSHLEGKSLVPLLHGDVSSVHEAAVTEMGRRGADPRLGWSLRTPRYRYIEWRRAGDLNAETPTFYSEVTAVELYDYEKDPLERVNLADNPEYKTVLKEHQKLFDRLLPYLPKRKSPPSLSSGPVYFSQDFEKSSDLTDYEASIPDTAQFNSIAAGAEDTFSIVGNALQLNKGAAVASTINRTRKLSASPLVWFCFQMDVNFLFTGQSPGKSLGFVDLYDKSPKTLWGSAVGFQVAASGADNLWRIAGGNGSFKGKQTVRVYVNNTGADKTYTDPVGTVRTLENTYMDIWVGNALVKSSPPANLNAANDINGFRFVSPANGVSAGTVVFDNFLIEAIP